MEDYSRFKDSLKRSFAYACMQYIFISLLDNYLKSEKTQSHSHLCSCTFALHALQKPRFDLFNSPLNHWCEWTFFWLVAKLYFQIFMLVLVESYVQVWSHTLIMFRGLTGVGVPRCILYIYSFLWAWQMCSNLHKAPTLSMSMWRCCSKWQLPPRLFRPC